MRISSLIRAIVLGGLFCGLAAISPKSVFADAENRIETTKLGNIHHKNRVLECSCFKERAPNLGVQTKVSDDSQSPLSLDTSFFVCAQNGLEVCVNGEGDYCKYTVYGNGCDPNATIGIKSYESYLVVSPRPSRRGRMHLDPKSWPPIPKKPQSKVWTDSLDLMVVLSEIFIQDAYAGPEVYVTASQGLSNFLNGRINEAITQFGGRGIRGARDAIEALGPLQNALSQGRVVTSATATSVAITGSGLLVVPSSLAEAAVNGAEAISVSAPGAPSGVARRIAQETAEVLGDDLWGEVAEAAVRMSDGDSAGANRAREAITKALPPTTAGDTGKLASEGVTEITSGGRPVYRAGQNGGAYANAATRNLDRATMVASEALPEVVATRVKQAVQQAPKVSPPATVVNNLAPVAGELEVASRAAPVLEKESVKIAASYAREVAEKVGVAGAPGVEEGLKAAAGGRGALRTVLRGAARVLPVVGIILNAQDALAATGILAAEVGKFPRLRNDVEQALSFTQQEAVCIAKARQGGGINADAYGDCVKVICESRGISEDKCNAATMGNLNRYCNGGRCFPEPAPSGGRQTPSGPEPEGDQPTMGGGGKDPRPGGPRSSSSDHACPGGEIPFCEITDASQKIGIPAGYKGYMEITSVTEGEPPSENTQKSVHMKQGTPGDPGTACTAEINGVERPGTWTCD